MKSGPKIRARSGRGPVTAEQTHRVKANALSRNRASTGARAGFTMIEMMVVTGIIALLASMAFAYFNRVRAYSQKNVCIKNLNTIEAAKQMWGVEKGKTTGATPVEADLIGVTLYIKQTPICPSGGTYSLGFIGSDAACTQVAEGHIL